MDEIWNDLLKPALNFALGFLSSQLRVLADFLFREILWTWRGAVVLVTAGACYVVARRYCLWITLLVLVLLAIQKMVVYIRGPKKNPAVVFSGFFAARDEDGKFRRSNTSSYVDDRFFKALKRLLEKHRVQEAFRIEGVAFRPPALLHTRLDYEGFKRLAGRYAARCLAVVWGVLGDGGRIKRFEVTIEEGQYFGGETLAQQLDGLKAITGQESVTADVAIDFVAYALVAVLAQSFCDHLIDSGNWRLSLLVANDSYLLLNTALTTLTKKGGKNGVAIAEDYRKQFSPGFLRQQACCLMAGKQRLAALEKLHEALMIEPLWPLSDCGEYKQYYDNLYAWQLLQQPIMTRYRSPWQPVYEQRSRVVPLPNLQLLFEWLSLVSEETGLPVDEVDGWFSTLAESHPQNPFVMVYWGDAIRITPLRGVGLPNEDDVKILDRAIEKYESARKCEPALSVLAVRVAYVYFLTASAFEEGSGQYTRRMRKGQQAMREGVRYIREVTPFALREGNAFLPR